MGFSENSLTSTNASQFQAWFHDLRGLVPIYSAAGEESGLHAA